MRPSSPSLQSATELGPLTSHDALRELVAAGIATNDTVEALREVLRAPTLPGRRRRDREQTDPTRWLPADFTPGPSRPVIWRRPSQARLPKWRRPDVTAPTAGWVGRWSLVRHVDPPDEQAQAEAIARQWLERYGVVTRDWWRRERPPVSWRSIYRELKRLELRGEIRRGYFVHGLAGAQFALPEAVEQLRAARDDADAPVIVMAASDPANPYALTLDAASLPPLARPRGRGSVLVTRAGQVMLAAEGRGRRVQVAPEPPRLT